MTDQELSELPFCDWMPSRIPIRDALVATIAPGVEFPRKLVPPGSEQRWYPQQNGGLQLMVPYDGGPFDASLFQIETGAWDHTTCDVCVARIPGMILCYVTTSDPYVGLCAKCYEKHAVRKTNP